MLLALALAPAVERLEGIDLDADPEPVTALLASRGRPVHLEQADVCALPYDDATF